MKPSDFPTGHEYVPTYPEPRTTELAPGLIHTDFRGGPCTTCDQPHEAHQRIMTIPPQVSAIVNRAMEASGASVEVRQSFNDHLDQYVVRKLHAWFNDEVKDAFLYGSHVVRDIGECTCFGGETGYGHEPHCGLMPLFKVDTKRHDADVIRRVVEKLPAEAVSERSTLLDVAHRIENGQEEGW